MNQERQERRKVIVIREELVGDQRLSLAERIVCMRVSSFEEYFEAAEECARALGVSKSTVQKAKCRLEKLGYIKCIRNTGRGKTYRSVLDEAPRVAPESYSEQQSLPSRVAETATQSSRNCYYSRKSRTIDLVTNVTKGELSSAPAVSEKEKAVNASESQTGEGAPKVAESAEPIKRESYGKSDINAMLSLWESKVGTLVGHEQANRRAVYNLLRNKKVGREKLERAVDFIAETKTERFAPRIADYAELQSKWNALSDFKRRRDAEKAGGQQLGVYGARTPYKRNGELSGAYNPHGDSPVVYERRPYDLSETPDPLAGFAEREKREGEATPEFIEQLRIKTFSKSKRNEGKERPDDIGELDEAHLNDGGQA